MKKIRNILYIPSFLKNFFFYLIFLIFFFTFTGYIKNVKMDDLVKFEPILNPTPTEIADYYSKNNIELPDNKYFLNYLNIEKEEPFKWSTQGITDTSGLTAWIPPKVESKPSNYVEIKQEDEFDSPKANEIKNEINSLDISEEDKKYLITMAGRESSFRPNIENRFGYYGLYQFGDPALGTAGFTKEDLNNTINQHKAALKYANINETILKPFLNKYQGKTFKGTKITKNGIRAAAHLLGAGTVKDWFNGTTKTKIAKRGFKDGNGVHITEYFKLFT